MSAESVRAKADAVEDGIHGSDHAGCGTALRGAADELAEAVEWVRRLSSKYPRPTIADLHEARSWLVRKDGAS